MITEAQAKTIIALLTEVRDELQRPRLARERVELEQQARDAAFQTKLAATRAADAADRASKPTLVGGGAGIPHVGELLPGQTLP